MPKPQVEEEDVLVPVAGRLLNQILEFRVLHPVYDEGKTEPLFQG